MPIELIVLVQYGTPVILLGVLLLMVWIVVAVSDLKEDVKGLKEGITWGDTCNERHTRIDKRLDKLENGG